MEDLGDDYRSAAAQHVPLCWPRREENKTAIMALNNAVARRLPSSATEATTKSSKRGDASSSSSGHATASAYRVEWNAEIGLATKTCVSGEVTVSRPIEVPSGASADDAVFATWDDGVVAQVPGVTVATVQELASSRKKSNGVLWETTAAGTHRRITIAQKVGISLRIAITEQGRQVCQARMDSFGEVLDQVSPLPPGHPTLVQATRATEDIDTRCAPGALAKADLYIAMG